MFEVSCTIDDLFCDFIDCNDFETGSKIGKYFTDNNYIHSMRQCKNEIVHGLKINFIYEL